MDHKDKIIQDLLSVNERLFESIGLLEAKVSQLQKELERYRNPKNSSNSSIPPSKDENRPFRNKSLRGKSGRKTGGQPGHEGHTLEITTTPDIIEEHVPCFCSCCGNDLSGIEAELSSRRQVVDIPPIKPVFTEHKSYTKTCPCGKKNTASFPLGVNAPIQYGSVVEAMVGYFHARQYVPYKRLKELLKNCFGIGLSEGTLENIISRLAHKASPLYHKMREVIGQSPVIGADETGAKVNGNKHWVWTYQTEAHTFLAMSESRGLKAIQSHFPDGFGNAVLCHDAWRTYFNYSENLHQLCFSHLLREINYIIERYRLAWAETLSSLFKEAIELKKKLLQQVGQQAKTHIGLLEAKLNKLLKTDIDPEHKEAVSLQKRLRKYRQSIFTFLYHEKVPPDNNASERAIRNIKVKQKVSGQFKSQKGGDNFCIIRSLVDTMIKRSENVMQNLSLLAKLHPE